MNRPLQQVFSGLAAIAGLANTAGGIVDATFAPRASGYPLAVNPVIDRLHSASDLSRYAAR